MTVISRAGGERAHELALVHQAAFSQGWSPDALLKLLAQPGVICLAGCPAAQAPVAGFVLARAVAGEAEILTLAVEPASRRLGLGRALIAQLCGILRRQDIVSLYLEVAEDNRAARALYDACGFALAGRRKAYYARNNERADALLLRYEVRVCVERRAGGDPDHE